MVTGTNRCYFRFFGYADSFFNRAIAVPVIGSDERYTVDTGSRHQENSGVFSDVLKYSCRMCIERNEEEKCVLE